MRAKAKVIWVPLVGGAVVSGALAFALSATAAKPTKLLAPMKAPAVAVATSPPLAQGDIDFPSQGWRLTPIDTSTNSPSVAVTATQASMQVLGGTAAVQTGIGGQPEARLVYASNGLQPGADASNRTVTNEISWQLTYRGGTPPLYGASHMTDEQRAAIQASLPNCTFTGIVSATTGAVLAQFQVCGP